MGRASTIIIKWNLLASAYRSLRSVLTVDMQAAEAFIEHNLRFIHCQYLFDIFINLITTSKNILKRFISIDLYDIIRKYSLFSAKLLVFFLFSPPLFFFSRERSKPRLACLFPLVSDIKSLAEVKNFFSKLRHICINISWYNSRILSLTLFIQN